MTKRVWVHNNKILINPCEMIRVLILKARVNIGGNNNNGFILLSITLLHFLLRQARIEEAL